MQGISILVAGVLLAQLPSTRIEPPATSFPAVPGTTPLTTNNVPAVASPAATVPAPAAAAPVVGQPTLAPPRTVPGLLPNNAATPLEPAPVSQTPVLATPALQAPASVIPSTTAVPNSATLTSGEQAAPLVKVETRGPKADAAELIDALMTSPEGIKLNGQPMTLLELLTSAADRQRQLAITQQYWRLAVAQIQFRLAYDDVHRLEQLQPSVNAQAQARARAGGALELQSRLASARARRGVAELALQAAQQALAEAAGLNSAAPLPLASDRPHTGSYRTLIDQIYGNRNVPAQARLFDRQTPLWRDAIQQQAAAVQSAYDAADAMIEALTRGETQPGAVWATLDTLNRANDTLVHWVQDYNFDIANYALTIPRSGISPQDLVGMLIKSPRSSAGPTANVTPTVVRPGTIIQDDRLTPATFEQSVPAPTRNEPTLAPPRDASHSPIPAQSPSTQTSQPAAGSATSSLGFGPREVRRPVIGEGVETGLYQALLDQAPAKRAQELTGLLHWDHSLPSDLGQPITLSECLQTVPPERRPAAIDAYWQAREWTARYQVVTAKLQQFDAFQAQLTAHLAAPGASEAMLRLRTARMLGKAEAVAAQNQLGIAQMNLMQQTGRPADGGWLLAATPPHGGRYELKLDALPKNVSSSRTVQQAAATIPLIYQTLEERAASVVLADVARADETNHFAASGSIADLPLEAIQRQAEETVAFLEALTRYNREIASYALHVLPANAPSTTVVQALVVHDGPTQ